MQKSQWYRIAVVAVLLVAIAVVLSGRKGADEQGTAGAGAPDPAAEVVTHAGAQETQAALPRMLALGGETCKVCQQMAPILEEVKREQAGYIRIEFIDVWKDSAAAEKYGISLIPTQIFFDAEGKEFFRHEGFYGKEEILDAFRKQGVELAESKAGG